MAKIQDPARPPSRSGPRAPAGKKPLTVIIDAAVVKSAKIRAIEDDTNVSKVSEELLKGWLERSFRLKKS